MIPKLQWRITELETMLEAAQEDAEYQKKLTQDLGMKIFILTYHRLEHHVDFKS